MDQEPMIKKFGDLVEGDIILGADGQEVRVTRAYDQHIPDKMYEIEMEDGTTIKASGNHLWYIETDIDHALHRNRRSEGKKLFKDLSQDAMDLLIESADYETPTETALMDMVTLANAEENRDATQALVRIAESMGHVAENKTSFEDVETGEAMGSTVLRTYDAKVFSQQLLSLAGDKKHRKRWPLIVGRVVTTEELVNFYSDAEIPVMRKISQD